MSKLVYKKSIKRKIIYLIIIMLIAIITLCILNNLKTNNNVFKGLKIRNYNNIIQSRYRKFSGSFIKPWKRICSKGKY